MRSQHCISCPEIPPVSGKERSSLADGCSAGAIRILLACARCHGDLSWQFGPKTKSFSLCPSLVSCMFEKKLWGRIWPGWGQAASLLLILPGWGAAWGSSTAGRPLPQLGNDKPQAAVPSSACSGHASSKPTQTLQKAFFPPSRSGGISKNCGHAVPWCPGEGDDAGRSTGDSGSCSCCPVSSAPPHVRLSVLRAEQGCDGRTSPARICK